eukprot:1856914-Amphidinium_carterae.1
MQGCSTVVHSFNWHVTLPVTVSQFTGCMPQAASQVSSIKSLTVTTLVSKSFDLLCKPLVECHVTAQVVRSGKISADQLRRCEQTPHSLPPCNAEAKLIDL